MVGSAPPFQRLDQFPSIVSYWLLLFAVLQAFAFSSSANSSSVALPANRVTSSSLGSGTSMTPNGFRIPRHFSAATFRFASLSDFIGPQLPQRCLAPTGTRSSFQQRTDLQIGGPLATRFPWEMCRGRRRDQRFLPSSKSPSLRPSHSVVGAWLRVVIRMEMEGTD